MEIGMIGLGRMGANMTQRLVRGGHRVVAYDSDPAKREQAAALGAQSVASLEEVAARLSAPRAVWAMVPAGETTESVVQALASLLAPGDIIIDGGNSYYKDSQWRAKALAQRGINFVDVGTSGGIWGLENGYCLMVGGDKAAVDRLTPIFRTLAPAPDRGWGHVGPSGAGHFVKMVHNGIEYGMMEALAEGFDILQAKQDMALDLHQIAELWRHGSVVRSWLLDLTAAALAEDPRLSTIKGWVADSGEGRWTVAESIDLDVPAPVIALALQMRFASRRDPQGSFGNRLLAALRHQFGGHAVVRET